MARNLDAKCRQCRREEDKLYLKGEKCYSSKCPFDREGGSIPPGQHGQKQGRKSEYAVQLRAKQKIRRTYGVLEGQFRLIYKRAESSRAVTGDKLLQNLESRLDNVVYRMGFGSSRTEARQLVRHNGIMVNGKRVNIPSFSLVPGFEVSLSEKARLQLRVKAALEKASERGFPEWLEVDTAGFKGVYKAHPERSELSPSLNESLVVELYSK